MVSTLSSCPRARPDRELNAQIELRSTRQVEALTGALAWDATGLLQLAAILGTTIVQADQTQASDPRLPQIYLLRRLEVSHLAPKLQQRKELLKAYLSNLVDVRGTKRINYTISSLLGVCVR
eukprot:4897066-Amphidinium_carterae.1